MDGSRSFAGLCRRQLIEAAHAAFDCGQETFFFCARCIDDVLGAGPQLGIYVAHLVDDDSNYLDQCRFAATEQPGVAHRAA